MVFRKSTGRSKTVLGKTRRELSTQVDAKKKVKAKTKVKPRAKTKVKPRAKTKVKPRAKTKVKPRAKAKTAESARPAARVISHGARDFVSRYQSGDFSAWDGLVKQCHTAPGPALLEEARAVAELLMRRVRSNVDQVRATLRKAGAALDGQGRPTPLAELSPLIELVGPLPVTLQALWTVVGSINLTPRYVEDAAPDYGKCSLEGEGIALIGLDPLQIDGADVDYLVDQYEEDDTLFVDLCPDFLGKQHLSGSDPLSVRLPASNDDRVDPDIGSDGASGLVGYLRSAFVYGGFPLLAVAKLPKSKIHVNFRAAFAGVQGPWGPAAERLREALCRGVEPF
jgi:hypothetical protein